jgi:predicted NBD/HSP70 family sugar kinase
VYRGAHGGAGEFGHLTVADGPECTCGKRGCLEAVAADPSLLRTARASGLLGADATIEDLRALADAGDPAALRIPAAAGEVVGRAVAGLVNVLDPRLVIVSGEGVAGWRHFDATFRAALHAHTFPPLRGVPVEIDPWDDAKWARGAAALVLRAMFAAPGAASADEAIRRRLATGRGVGATGVSA